jgi:hypothetical protein
MPLVRLGTPAVSAKESSQCALTGLPNRSPQRTGQLAGPMCQTGTHRPEQGRSVPRAQPHQQRLLHRLGETADQAAATPPQRDCIRCVVRREHQQHERSVRRQSGLSDDAVALATQIGCSTRPGRPATSARSAATGT